MKTKLFVSLIMVVFASKEYGNAENAKSGERMEDKTAEDSIVVKIEEAEYVKKKAKSNYIGVFYDARLSKWRACRGNKSETAHNGSYDNAETAAHASDTFARKLMKNDGYVRKLNFPDDDTEVHKEEKMKTSKYIGVFYHKQHSRWTAYRRSKNDRKVIYNGSYKNEETAAHASDTLARFFNENGKQGLKLNFPDDHIEVHSGEKRGTYISQYIGVGYETHTRVTYNTSKWRAYRYSKLENKKLSNGYYDNEETAAHASDILAKKLTDNGEQGHKLNFPDGWQEYHRKKRKRQDDFQDN